VLAQPHTNSLQIPFQTLQATAIFNTFVASTSFQVQSYKYPRMKQIEAWNGTRIA